MAHITKESTLDVTTVLNGGGMIASLPLNDLPQESFSEVKDILSRIEDSKSPVSPQDAVTIAVDGCTVYKGGSDGGRDVSQLLQIVDKQFVAKFGR